MRDVASLVTNYNGGPFPGYSAKNATGAGATDGTEWIKALVDDFLFGPFQAILDHEGISPNGVAESAGSSQIVEAIQKMVPPGIVVEWNLNADPATTGHRYLLLNGQGILRSNYPDLDTNVYVGDGNNATADAYYRADDAAGTIRNTVGIYLILPESRGYTTRGLDLAASIDPDGASRTVGHLQLDAMQRITGDASASFGGRASFNLYSGVFSGDTVTTFSTAGTGTGDRNLNFDNSLSTSPNNAKTNDVETRMANRATQFAIRY